MFKAYKEAAKKVLKDISDRIWREGEEKELWAIITRTVLNEHELHPDYWIKRLYGYFARRLRSSKRTKWIPILAEFTNTMAYGELVDQKTRKYCLLIRDRAKEELLACRKADETASERSA